MTHCVGSVVKTNRSSVVTVSGGFTVVKKKFNFLNSFREKKTIEKKKTAINFIKGCNFNKSSNSKEKTLKIIITMILIEFLGKVSKKEIYHL